MNKPTLPLTQPEQPSRLPEDRHREREVQRSPRRRWLWAMAIVILVLVVYLLARHRGQKSSSAAAPGAVRVMPATPVTAATAHKGNIGVYFTGLGAVTPIYTVTVTSRVDGQLMNVYYKEGQTVHKGDLLAEIDPRPFEVQLKQAEGQLIKDQANLQNARVDLARYQELIKRNAVAEQQLATQQATVVQDEGIVKTDQGMIDSAKLNLVYSKITSPITGRVGLRLVDPGNIILASGNTPLLVITQIEPISVIFTISEDQVPPIAKRFRAGERLEVDAYDRNLKKKLSQGYLLTMDNQIDQTTGTLKLRAIFDNKDDALFPNQFVNARLLVEEKQGVTLIPTAAIQRSSQRTYVYLVKPDQTVTVRNVTLGTTEGDQTEVVSGLVPGDVAVTTGVDKLQEGTKVNAQITDGGGSGARPGS
jgi:membrane fusion protein, multidrug efflux system